ncbi:hypothetical protein IAT40_006235 [Kwoniella sp. CBS 6097]
MFALSRIQLLFLLVALVSMMSALAAPIDFERNDSVWGSKNVRSNRADMNKRSRMTNAERLKLGLPLKKPVVWGADGRQVKL